MKNLILIICSLLVFSELDAQRGESRSLRLEKKAMRRSSFVSDMFAEWNHVGGVKVDSIIYSIENKSLEYYFNPSTTQIPVRTIWLEKLNTELRKKLGRKFRDVQIRLLARGKPLEDYIPNVFRNEKSSLDMKRMSPAFNGSPLITRANQPEFEGGLTGNHIALWPSHGYFFDQQLDRWQWQRARLWQTVEDIFPWSFTMDYLVPMLENSGANVLLPRERDIQINEVIVDNNDRTGNSGYIIYNGNYSWDSSKYNGFMRHDTLYPGQNPFESGTSLSLKVQPDDSAIIKYIPVIPETGDYAVYISYARAEQCLEKVQYEVRYAGGIEKYYVNQCMGDGTWIYLGTFRFHKGSDPEKGSVCIKSTGQGIITSDAVRFGGGMGNVARKPGMKAVSKQKSVNDGIPLQTIHHVDSFSYRYQISGKPRWMEGSRYYLQYSGMPDSLTFNLSGDKNDYNDDYMSRPEWVNYLIGNSRIQFTDKYRNGKGIPIDIALAFHTDAGITENDSIIGTLGIYSAVRNDGIFPDGRTRLASRDLTDIIQTQLVEDIRRNMNPRWTRRGLWDREYSEAWRPIVPAMLLELLSHQNLSDMKYGLDPRFKFTASRAVYKGILKYLAFEQHRDAIIQPLPPDHMSIEILNDRRIKISWKPVEDLLEPSAYAEGYKVYQKAGNDGFGPGMYTADSTMILELNEYGIIYSFKVTALNSGGESFPGETLSVAVMPGSKKPVLIVNAFDRTAAPAFFDKGDMAGIAWWDDEGVPYIRDMSFSGYQYDFDRNSQWISDDNQGWGASSADMEGIAIAGNSFDFPQIHGQAIVDAGYGFTSVSDEVFERPDYNHLGYDVADIIFGEERGTASFEGDTGKDFRLFTAGMIRAIEGFTQAGKNVFLSGAYIGTDMAENHDSSAIHFAADVLHYIWRTHHATRIGLVNATDQGQTLFPDEVHFNMQFDPYIYRVESPDAIEPVGKEAFRICRYNSGNTSAGIAYDGAYRSIVLGFPFETITTGHERKELMERILKFFNEGLAD